MGKFLTKEEVIDRCNKANNYKYDYSEIEYNGRDNIITPICPKHGKFEIIAKYHMEGIGCKKCQEEKIISLKKFLEKSKSSHPENFDEYDYSLITEEVFSKNRKNLPIIHKKCGNIFHQSMYNHMDGANCPFCLNESNQERIKKAKEKFGDKFDYSKANFSNKIKPTDIFCNECKKWFKMSYTVHINSKLGCSNCYLKTIVHDTKSFIEKANRVNHNMYDYTGIEYKGAYEIIYTRCKRCGNTFPVLTYAHLNGSGCPICNRNSSKLEFEIDAFLKQNKINFIPQFKDFEWLKTKYGNLSFDFYLPDYNIAIECQGKQHFGLGKFAKEGDYEKILERDNRKKRLCEENNVKLLYYSNLKINYPYFVYTNKEELLKEILSNNKVNISES